MTSTWKQGNCRREQNATLTWQRQHWHRKSDPDYSAHDHVVIWRRVVFAKSVYYAWALLGYITRLVAELWRAKRAGRAPWVSKSTHPRKFGNHVTDRPSDRPSVRTTGIPMFTLTRSSYFGSQGESWLHISVVINWQLSKQGIRWPVSPDRIAGSGVDPSRSSIF